MYIHSITSSLSKEILRYESCLRFCIQVSLVTRLSTTAQEFKGSLLDAVHSLVQTKKALSIEETRGRQFLPSYMFRVVVV